MDHDAQGVTYKLTREKAGLLRGLAFWIRALLALADTTGWADSDYDGGRWVEWSNDRRGRRRVFESSDRYAAETRLKALQRGDR